MSRAVDLTADRPSIQVAAGILLDDHGRALIARRPEGVHQAGWWEFPGGKMGASESASQALVRELAEEIGIVVRSARPLMRYTCEYPERLVTLHVFVVEDYTGRPVGREGQALRWEPVEALAGIGLLPADLPIVERLLSERDRRD